VPEEVRKENLSTVGREKDADQLAAGARARRAKRFFFQLEMNKKQRGGVV